MSEWLIAACVNVVGNIAINFGTNLIKYSHLQAEESFLDALKEPNAVPPSTKATGSGSKLWWTGVIIFSTGNVLNFASFSFGNQSQLAALGSIQFLTNVAFSNLVLNVSITKRVLRATAIIVFGNTLIVVFSSHESSSYTTSELIDLYGGELYVWYIRGLAAAVISLQLSYGYLRGMQKRYNKLQYRLSNPLPLPDIIGRLVPFFYALVSGLIGTQAVVLAKSCSEIFRVTLSGDNQLDEPATYLLLLCWILTMTFWLRRMNRALQRFDAVFIIPVLQVIWILFSIISGGLYFQEFNDLDLFNGMMFILGVLFIIIGVYFLTPPNQQLQLDTGDGHTGTERRHSISVETPRINSTWMDLSISVPMAHVNDCSLIRRGPPSGSNFPISQIDPSSKLLMAPKMKRRSM